MSDFLYPFLSGESGSTTALHDDLVRSARSKIDESATLRAASLAACGPVLDAAASELAVRFTAGGRMYTVGNGGSSTDAATLAGLFSDPSHGPSLPARTLTADVAVLTALSNDVGYELVFSRQVAAAGGPNDTIVGLSTSGSSANVMQAFETAKRLGMCTIGFAGYSGGTMATTDSVDHLLLVESDSVHRIQETQAALGHELWRRTVRKLGSTVD